jgi:ribonuclease Z
MRARAHSRGAACAGTLARGMPHGCSASPFAKIRRMDLSVLFLGTAGSMPTVQRAPSSLLIRRGGDRVLIDCGEGTQRQLLRSIGLPDVEHVFLTHYHADHFLGLPGMMKTFALRGREAPLHVYGPRGLSGLMSDLRRIYGKLTYEVSLQEVAPSDYIPFDGYRIGVYAVKHRTEALGYALVEDDRPGRFNEARALELGVRPGPDYGRLQRGETIAAGAGSVAPSDVLGPARPGRKLVFTGDTTPCEATVAIAQRAQLLVHDGTFTDDELERAALTGHSTARQAAEVALEADVGLLALTHLSSRYFPAAIEKEGQAVFERTVVPRDFDVIEVPYPDADRGAPALVSWKDYRSRIAEPSVVPEPAA